MKHLSRISVATLCATCLLASAVAAKPQGWAPVDFQRLDADGDGKITRDEMQTAARRHFLEADADGDGAVSREELKAHADARAQQRVDNIMTRLDRDKDGVISPDELPDGGRALRRFDRADTDGDGAISQAEYDAARERMAKRRASRD